MKLGIVIGTNETETAYNALRLAVAALNAGHGVCVFLLNTGVELNEAATDPHDLKGQLSVFAEKGGKSFACGTCRQSRQKQASAVCPVSSMADLLKLVEESDKVLTFG